MVRYSIPIMLLIITVAFTAYAGFDGNGSASLNKTDIESISGTVIDSSSGKALEGATVMIGSMTIKTDSNGKFTLKGIGQSEHMIQSFHLGNENYASPISVGNGESLSHDISMNSTPKVIIR